MGKKWESCVKQVKAKNGAYNPYAVCTAKVGRLNAKRGKLGLTTKQRRRELGNILFDKPKRGFFVNEDNLLFGYRGRKKGIALANPFKVPPLGSVKAKGWVWSSLFKRK